MFKLKFVPSTTKLLLIALISIFFGVLSYKFLIARSFTKSSGTDSNPEIIFRTPSFPTGKTQDELVTETKQDLASKLDLDIKKIEASTVSVEAVNWPDASLGCPDPGMIYAQVVTPGYKIVLEVKDQVYIYHTSSTNFKLCDPIQ